MIVNIMKFTRERLLELSMSEVGGSTLSDAELKRVFSGLGVWFNFDYAKSLQGGMPPHAVQMNKMHTDTYFMHRAFFHNSAVAKVLASQVTKKLSLGKSYVDLSYRERAKHKPVWVIGPSNGATFLVAAMAEFWNCWQGVSTTIVGKDQEWQSLPVPGGVTVQLVDDLLYTADSVLACRSAVLEALPHASEVQISDEIGVIVNLSSHKDVHGMKIKSLINIIPKKWQPDECELCAQGSKPLTIQNDWPQLAESCWQEPPD